MNRRGYDGSAAQKPATAAGRYIATLSTQPVHSRLIGSSQAHKTAPARRPVSASAGARTASSVRGLGDGLVKGGISRTGVNRPSSAGIVGRMGFERPSSAAGSGWQQQQQQQQLLHTRQGMADQRAQKVEETAQTSRFHAPPEHLPESSEGWPRSHLQGLRDPMGSAEHAQLHLRSQRCGRRGEPLRAECCGGGWRRAQHRCDKAFAAARRLDSAWQQ